jgi:hypothetical protein
VRQPIPQNVATLQAAGYTVEADKKCIVDAIRAHKLWSHTTSDVAFSPFPDVFAGGLTDVTYTNSMMDFCRATLGARCGLENNGASQRRLGDPDLLAVYAHMRELGGAVTFQTASSNRIGDWTVALDAALTYGAGSVELPTGYLTWSQSQLAQYGAVLAGGSQ